jgi:hypothetical protein
VEASTVRKGRRKRRKFDAELRHGATEDVQALREDHGIRYLTVLPSDVKAFAPVVAQLAVYHRVSAPALIERPLIVGPLLGHNARQLPVIGGRQRPADPAQSSLPQPTGGLLPSWSWEFNSRHPLHSISPGQSASGAFAS